MAAVCGIPGAERERTPVNSIIKRLWKKIHWHANEFLIRRPGLLARIGIPLTVVDAFGTPGDTLLTAIVCRELKRHHPRLKINCVTPNPSLLKLDPNINRLNGPKTFCAIQFWYLGIIHAKDAVTNVLKPTMDTLGIRDYQYRAQVYLSPQELEAGKRRVASLGQPIVTINAMSREVVKVWPQEFWLALIRQLSGFATIVQLGDEKEPVLPDVLRLAGTLSMRESMSILSQASLHIGSVSFLMHAASGLGIPSIIIFGGRETPQNSGYADNQNLYTPMECSPCWLHDSRGDRCPYDIKCMSMITPDQVWEAIERRLALGKA